MYQPTEYQKSIFKLVEHPRGLEPLIIDIRRDFPISTTKKVAQYVIAKFAFIVEQMELGKTVLDYHSATTCAGCDYARHVSTTEYNKCDVCPVDASCSSYMYERYCEGAGRNIYYARRVLAMLQRHYERMFGDGA